VSTVTLPSAPAAAANADSSPAPPIGRTERVAPPWAESTGAPLAAGVQASGPDGCEPSGIDGWEAPGVEGCDPSGPAGCDVPGDEGGEGSPPGEGPWDPHAANAARNTAPPIHHALFAMAPPTQTIGHRSGRHYE
jgi:hypothetical protein